MRDDLVEGNAFPDVRLPDHTGRECSLSELAGARPLVLNFVRGWWCPKEQVRLRTLVTIQDGVQREYARIAVVTVDSPSVNGAFRAGLGAAFPFLSDEGRTVANDLDLVELTDAKHRPYLPYTFVLDSLLRIHSIWCGFWYFGNPTPEELRVALREITRREQPTFDPQPVWAGRGSAPPDAGIAGEAIWVREDSDGREIQRGVLHGDVPEVGAELSRSEVDGRPWVVHEVERAGGRVAVHLRKGGEVDTSQQVRHSITAPPAGTWF
jgi:peroxiredoxin